MSAAIDSADTCSKLMRRHAPPELLHCFNETATTAWLDGQPRLHAEIAALIADSGIGADEPILHPWFVRVLRSAVRSSRAPGMTSP